jgi:hypothetical protein
MAQKKEMALWPLLCRAPIRVGYLEVGTDVVLYLHRRSFSCAAAGDRRFGRRGVCDLHHTNCSVFIAANGELAIGTHLPGDCHTGYLEIVGLGSFNEDLFGVAGCAGLAPSFGRRGCGPARDSQAFRCIAQRLIDPVLVASKDKRRVAVAINNQTDDQSLIVRRMFARVAGSSVRSSSIMVSRKVATSADVI